MMTSYTQPPNLNPKRPVNPKCPEVVWRAELYRTEAHGFYRRVDRNSTLTHQSTISDTIRKFTALVSFLSELTTSFNFHHTTQTSHVLHKNLDSLVFSCGCLDKLISSFLHHVMSLLIRKFASCVMDTKPGPHIFQIINFFGHKFIFTMDVKSLYTVIPYHDGLRAPK